MKSLSSCNHSNFCTGNSWHWSTFYADGVNKSPFRYCHSSLSEGSHTHCQAVDRYKRCIKSFIGRSQEHVQPCAQWMNLAGYNTWGWWSVHPQAQILGSLKHGLGLPTCLTSFKGAQDKLKSCYWCRLTSLKISNVKRRESRKRVCVLSLLHKGSTMPMLKVLSFRCQEHWEADSLQEGFIGGTPQIRTYWEQIVWVVLSLYVYPVYICLAGAVFFNHRHSQNWGAIDSTAWQGCLHAAVSCFMYMIYMKCLDAFCKVTLCAWLSK